MRDTDFDVRSVLSRQLRLWPPTDREQTYQHLMGFAKTRWPMQQTGSILKQLLKRYGPNEVEVMVKGAALLGWKDLRGLYSKEGIGRRWAQAAWWAKENQNPHARQQVESLGAMFKARGLL